MINIVYVFVGGGLGSVARYLLSGTVYRWIDSIFPYGTLVVNTIGCFLIGLVMAGFSDRFALNPSTRIFLTIGLLGGFTTFSSFSFETIALLRDGELFPAAVNIAGSLITCLAATYAGTLIGKSI